MKYFAMVFAFLYSNFTYSQEKINTRVGKISFEASIPSFEEVKGENDKVYCVLNIKTGAISIMALIKEFKFKHDLMKTHFNESYMESHHYPRATFKGKIDDFNWSTIGTELKAFTLKGKLEMHGITKEITTIVKLRKMEKGIEIRNQFEVNTDDFQITIPIIVRSKIAKIVHVETFFQIMN